MNIKAISKTTRSFTLKELVKMYSLINTSVHFSSPPSQEGLQQNLTLRPLLEKTIFTKEVHNRLQIYGDMSVSIFHDLLKNSTCISCGISHELNAFGASECKIRATNGRYAHQLRTDFLAYS
jgi:hypothetical protein